MHALNKKKKILHLITGLEVGGAEMMLLRTVEHSNTRRYSHHVISLKGEGELGPKLEEAGAQVLALELHRPKCFLPGLIRLVQTLATHRKAVLQCWLAHGILVGSLASLLVGHRKIIWSIHSG
ncbi:MAG: group 1 glycosyl transferase, partial [Verrucomicrobiota bacterium]